MRWPWVSREQYDLVLAAKNEIIQLLKEQNIALRERMDTPIAVSVSLPEGFAVQMPAVVGRRGKNQDKTIQRPVTQEIDWSSVNENDNEAIARIAAKELGAPVPPYVLAGTVSRIKSQIRSAKQEKLRKTLQEGRVGTQSSPALTEEDAIAQGSSYIPSSILKEIENAERG